VDLATPEARREIIGLYVDRYVRRTIGEQLMDELVNLSEGFAGADIEAAVREVAIDAYLKGDDAVTDDLFRRSFTNVVPLSKTNPEQIEAIRTWGRERAVPASGIVHDAGDGRMRPRRGVLV